jgi:Cysteine-rich secretory protein family
MCTFAVRRLGKPYRLLQVLPVRPAFALDLNSFRAQHGRPPLSQSSRLAGAAYSHAHSLAARQRLDMQAFGNA